MNKLVKSKTFLTLVLGLLVVALPSWAAELPKELRQQANKAFADGKSYFIWVEEKAPLTGGELPFGSVVGITLHYLASDKTKPEVFRVKMELTGVDFEKELGTTFVSVSDEEAGGKREGKKSTVLLAEGKKLTGSGVARVYLIADADEKATKPKAISNTLEVKVEFPKTK